MSVTILDERNDAAIDPIVAAASPSAGEVAACPGRAPPGCLVALNIRGAVAENAQAVSGLIDPRQPVVPLALRLDANANLTFRMFSGSGNKTINAEGDGISAVYTPGDFNFESVRSQLNRLPLTGAISTERPLRLELNEAGGTGAQVIAGTLIGVATDKSGKVDRGRLAYYLRRMGNGNIGLGRAPQAVQLCARGFQVVGGFAVPAPCEGKFPAGFLVPLKGNLVTLQAATQTDINFGPLQPMVPVAVVAETALTDLTFQVLDPESGKPAEPTGGDDPFTGASSSSGSLISGQYSPTLFTNAAIRSGVNGFPWTTLGAMSKERPLILRATSTGGGDVRFWVHAFVLNDNGTAPPQVWEYVRASAAAT